MKDKERDLRLTCSPRPAPLIQQRPPREPARPDPRPAHGSGDGGRDRHRWVEVGVEVGVEEWEAKDQIEVQKVDGEGR